MATIGTLWCTPTLNKGLRIRATAALAGLSLDIPSEYKHYEDNHKPEFRAKFPHGKIPAFESKDGFVLFETSAIARYIASLAPDVHLLGQTAREAALVDQWVSLIDGEFHPAAAFVYQISTGRLEPYSQTMYDSKKETAVRALKTIEGHIASHDFLVGEGLTLADITLVFDLRVAYPYFVDKALREETPNLLWFYERVSQEPKIKELIGETKFCETMVVGPPKKE